MGDVGGGLIARAWQTYLGEDSPAQAGASPLGTEYRDNAHKPSEITLRKRPECKRRHLVESTCGHGNSFWWAKNCDSWKCDACTSWRLETEIKPEIRRAILWAKSRGETLKFITPTWKDTDLGAQPTPEGKQRRKLDRQHLVQHIRRDLGRFFEYARVPEQHKSGKFHEHWLAVADYLDEDQLQAQWMKHTRGSSFNVHVQAVALRCPNCWPGRLATPEQKKASRIVPLPNRRNKLGKVISWKGGCSNCGFTPDWYLPSWWDEIANQASEEMSKYLVKTAQSGISGKLISRSKGWRDNCQDVEPEPLDGPSTGEPVVCESCDAVHGWNFVGPLLKLAKGFDDDALTARLVLDVDRVYSYGASGPCGCWTPSDKEGQQKTPPAELPAEFNTERADMVQGNFINLAEHYN